MRCGAACVAAAPTGPERFCLEGCFGSYLVALGFPGVVLIGLKLDQLLVWVPSSVAMIPFFILDVVGLLLNCDCCAVWVVCEHDVGCRCHAS